MPKAKIDNHAIEVAAGTTILEAAKTVGIEIPTLCHWPGLVANTSCFVCVVKVNGSPRMFPSCATVVTEGMVIESETAEVQGFRRAAMELLLAEHTGDCFAPCQAVCPAHMDIPTMMRYINTGDLREAVATVKRAIPLPATLGRICPELCEKGCRRSSRDEAVSICSLKRYVGDKDLASEHPYLPECAAATGKRVAVVGTGPAGLTAAWFLLQHGHAVEMFDSAPLPGGALRYSIDEERLPRATLDAEIKLVELLGAKFRMNTSIPDRAALEKLQKEFDAVLLAVGPVAKEFAAALGLPMAGKGLKVDKETLRTPLEKVFAAGSALIPAHYAIRAVADGQTAADSIHARLSGATLVPEAPPFAARLGRLSGSEAEAFFKGVPETARQAPKGNPAGTPTLADEAALAESLRCAHCDCGKLGGCKLRQVAIMLNANPAKHKGARREFARVDTHPLLTYEPGKCILCGICVQLAAKSHEPLGLSFTGRGFGVQVAPPLGADISAALQRCAAEVCGTCPTGALTLKVAAGASYRQDERYVTLPLPQLRN